MSELHLKNMDLCLPWAQRSCGTKDHLAQGSEQNSANVDAVSQTGLDLISNFLFSVNLFIPKQRGIDVFVFTTMDLYFFSLSH